MVGRVCIAKRLGLYKRTTYNHARPLEEPYSATPVTKAANGPEASPNPTDHPLPQPPPPLLGLVSQMPAMLRSAVQR